MGTHYTDWVTHQDGDTQQWAIPSDYDPDSLSNMEVQFRGNSKQRVGFHENTDPNTYNPSGGSDEFGQEAVNSADDLDGSLSDGDDFTVEHDIRVETINDVDGTAYVTWGTHFGSRVGYYDAYGVGDGGFANRGYAESFSVSSSSSYTNVHYNTFDGTWSYAGQEREIAAGAWVGPGTNVDVKVTLNTHIEYPDGTSILSANQTFEYYSEPSRTDSVTFPSLNSGETFDYHSVHYDASAFAYEANEDIWEYNRGMTYEVSYPDGTSDIFEEPHPGNDSWKTIYDNYIGEDVNFTFYRTDGYVSSKNVDITARTGYKYYDQTQDPQVDDTGTSATGAYSGTLDNDNKTSWISFPHFANGGSTSSFEVSTTVSGSNQVDIRFRYDYELDAPTPVDYKEVELNGTIYTLPLVDPNDSALENGQLEYYASDQYLAADLVDPSDPDASPYEIYIPGVGVLAWRKDVS